MGITHEAGEREVRMWRNYFLDQLFCKEYKWISDASKDRIRGYFLSIPSDSFTDPASEVHKCIAVMFEHMEKEGGWGHDRDVMKDPFDCERCGSKKCVRIESYSWNEETRRICQKGCGTLSFTRKADVGK